MKLPPFYVGLLCTVIVAWAIAFFLMFRYSISNFLRAWHRNFRPGPEHDLEKLIQYSLGSNPEEWTVVDRPCEYSKAWKIRNGTMKIAVERHDYEPFFLRIELEDEHEYHESSRSFKRTVSRWFRNLNRVENDAQHRLEILQHEQNIAKTVDKFWARMQNKIARI